ncbi:MAG TPA: ABC transporter substrate-binding protein, partial [Pseudonocardiaceae bacterium]
MASVLALAALTVVACGSGGNTAGNSSNGQGANSGYNQVANQNSVGTPQQGGTLQIVGMSDIDHLDTASAYTTYSSDILRTMTRQLFAYPASANTDTATNPVADLATQLPTQANGGLSADGKTYTIHLKQGVDWNTSPPRQVTAQDEVLGIKRLCNPYAEAGAPQYYTDTIVGMATFCSNFATVPQTIDAYKQYLTGTNIPGVKAVNASTVQFTLTKPASDFVNILSMGFASPSPVEYLNYMPDDPNFRQNTISDGPYKIS